MANCNYRQPMYPGVKQPMPRANTARSGNYNYYRQQPEQHAENMYEAVDKLPKAMGYVPMQKFNETFDLCKGLQAGTIFPELYKPFCGKGGAC